MYWGYAFLPLLRGTKPRGNAGVNVRGYAQPANIPSLRANASERGNPRVNIRSYAKLIIPSSLRGAESPVAIHSDRRRSRLILLDRHGRVQCTLPRDDGDSVPVHSSLRAERSETWQSIYNRTTTPTLTPSLRGTKCRGNPEK